jgi:hypothetical protein
MNAHLTTKTLRNLALATLLIWSFATEADAQEISKETQESASTKQSNIDLYGY